MFIELESAPWIELALGPLHIPTNLSQPPHCYVLRSGQTHICAASSRSSRARLIEIDIGASNIYRSHFNFVVDSDGNQRAPSP
jgi:hypothetical protein